MNPWPRNLFGRILLGIWSSQICVPMAILVGLGLLLRLGRIKRSFRYKGAFHLRVAGVVPDMFLAKNRNAFTAGWIVLWMEQRTAKPEQLPRIALKSLFHELRHEMQYMWLGLLIAPLYLISQLAVGYRRNPFEVDARKAAEAALAALAAKPALAQP